jgi:hypothetical protein
MAQSVASSHPPTEITSRTTRVAISLGIGAALGIFSWAQLAHMGAWIQANDFTYVWFGARSILHGIDPYIAVKSAELPWGPYLFYPVPAFLLAVPFAPFPAQIAGPLFIGVSSAFLALLLKPHWRLWIFISGPLLVAAQACQWTPLLVAAAIWTPAMACLAAKPTLALPLVAMQSQLRFVRPAMIGGALILALSFAIQPHWLPEWLTASRLAARAGGYWIPAATPLGAILSLAALRWRRPEARLLLVLAWMPQKLLFYDQLPLLLIPSTRREMQVAVLLSMVAFLLTLNDSWAHAEATHRLLPAVIIGLYWPALFLVFYRRKDRAPIQSAHFS